MNRSHKAIPSIKEMLAYLDGFGRFVVFDAFRTDSVDTYFSSRLRLKVCPQSAFLLFAPQQPSPAALQFTSLLLFLLHSEQLGIAAPRRWRSERAPCKAKRFDRNPPTMFYMPFGIQENHSQSSVN